MKKSIKIMTIILVLSILLPVLMNNALEVSGYSGSVEFSGVVTIKTSEDPIGGVSVILFEDGNQKRSAITNSTGHYSFSWTVAPLRIYTIQIEEYGYRDRFKPVIPRSSTVVVDFEIDGRVALFLWASDATNETVMEEYGDYLIDNEGFSDVLYREDQSDWEDCIDDVDSLETSDSLVFIYLIAHGDTTGGSDAANGGDSMVYYNTLDNPGDYILSSEFCDKLECLESDNIIVVVESCDSGDFVDEYEKESRSNENIFIIASTYYAHPDDYYAVMWFGVNYTFRDANDPPLYNSYGGGFSYYFFDNLADGYSENTAFTNSDSSVATYSETYFDEYLNITQTQEPQLYDNLATVWFG